MSRPSFRPTERLCLSEGVQQCSNPCNILNHTFVLDILFAQTDTTTEHMLFQNRRVSCRANACFVHASMNLGISGPRDMVFLIWPEFCDSSGSSSNVCRIVDIR